MHELRERLREFVAERDWEKFHTPKNLAMALAGEAAEIMEIFQWLTPEESGKLPDDKMDEIKDEVGDVLIYLIRLADKLGIDPMEAANQKMEKNRKKYPADLVRGRADKYTAYQKQNEQEL
jgi:dCTP diphosphatase